MHMLISKKKFYLSKCCIDTSTSDTATLGIRHDFTVCMLSERTLLQLGLLRVVTWPGSRFGKQRIKAQVLLNPPLLRDVLQSYVQLVRHECSPFRKDCDGGGSFVALREV